MDISDIISDAISDIIDVVLHVVYTAGGQSACLKLLKDYFIRGFHDITRIFELQLQHLNAIVTRMVGSFIIHSSHTPTQTLDPKTQSLLCSC